MPSILLINYNKKNMESLHQEFYKSSISAYFEKNLKNSKSYSKVQDQMKNFIQIAKNFSIGYISKLFSYTTIAMLIQSLIWQQEKIFSMPSYQTLNEFLKQKIQASKCQILFKLILIKLEKDIKSTEKLKLKNLNFAKKYKRAIVKQLINIRILLIEANQPQEFKPYFFNLLNELSSKPTFIEFQNILNFIINQLDYNVHIENPRLEKFSEISEILLDSNDSPSFEKIEKIENLKNDYFTAIDNSVQIERNELLISDTIQNLTTGIKRLSSNKHNRNQRTLYFTFNPKHIHRTRF